MCSAIAFRIGLIGSRMPSPFAAAGAGASGTYGDSVWSGRRWLRLVGALHEGDQVLLANPPADAVPLDLREIDVVLVRHAANHGRDEPGAVAFRRIGVALCGRRAIR